LIVADDVTGGSAVVRHLGQFYSRQLTDPIVPKFKGFFVKLGVFVPNWIGDVVMATPALRALRKYAGPGGTMIGVMRPYVAEVLDGKRWFDASLLYKKKPGWHWSALKSQLCELDLDVVVLLTNSFRTGWMAWESGAKQRIGYAGNLRSWMLTTQLYTARRQWTKVGLPPIDSYLNLAYATGCEWEPPTLELATTDADEQAADAAWHQLGLPHPNQVIVLNSGGAFGGSKHWPAEHFAALARRLGMQDGYSVLVNCGPSEREIANQIIKLADCPQVFSLAGLKTLPIGLTKAIIRRARMLVTTDSGPRYFGIAFSRPVVTLFGPTDPHTTRNYYDKETTLTLDLPCQPCWEATCPLSHGRCMSELSVDMVYRATKDLLSEEPGVNRVA
jgi:heptosyltransferase-2